MNAIRRVGEILPDLVAYGEGDRHQGDPLNKKHFTIQKLTNTQNYIKPA